MGVSPQSPAPDRGSPLQPRYHTGVSLTALNVTVVDPQGRPIGGLARGDFVVYEDGIKQDVSYFESSELPTDLVLLIDTSTSMQSRLRFVRKAAAEFARALRPGDRAALFDFSNRINVRQPLTTEIGILSREIESTKANGGTALYDAVYVALKELSQHPIESPLLRRRVIVVLSDGLDNASHISFDTLSAEVQRRDVTIYTICPQDLALETEMDLYRHMFRQRRPRADYAMRWLAQQTGATFFTPWDEVELAGAYQSIGNEMAHQYLLGYVSSNPPGPGILRNVTIQAVRPAGARPRTRTGYVG